MAVPMKITGMTQRGQEDSINASFDSIERLIEDWEPKTTQQNFATLAYIGPLKKETKVTVKELPFSPTPVFGVYGRSYIYVGTLETSGVFTSTWDSDGLPVVIYQTYPAKRS